MIVTYPALNSWEVSASVVKASETFSLPVDLKLINREILLSFWKVHVLHHAAEGEVIGQWMLKELAHHGYDVSPGTLYPLLKRMETNGWLTSTADATRGPKAPRSYKITKDGRAVLKIVRQQLKELGVEVGK